MKRPSVETVLEKASNVKGRLRTIKVKHIAGKKNLISEHRENNCVFKFNVETCYFSPRLANERQTIAEKIKRDDKVLVMFAGVGVFPIVIYKNSKPRKVVGVELGRDCVKYFKENLKLNKIPEERIDAIQGDVKKKITKGGLMVKGNLVPLQFDVVVMARPNLKESFLKWGLLASKKGTKLIYYGFCRSNELDEMVKGLEKEAKKLKRKIKIGNIVKAGEIAPFKHRWRIEISVLN